MLEVKNLCKEYKGKKGVVTKALDNVSLNFPEKGMVFILGKSGSGKSTLLNICGGLDKADSGEIVIKGKSSRDFSGQDFDSYRNTFVGFVFQEYNILDEFSVEQNIALALELQNKKRDKKVIDKILSDVDLTDFASRKPNTLSGGQKQRVAIARALVKEPEIIMADEPTGALDSKTGQQVFDTLKKLSQDKLVIVISHDRDFAEQYGDRIIELKDGRIISDQTRATEGDAAKNVRFFGTDTVCVANGAQITDEDLLSIKKFLNRSGGAAVISTSREQIADMKEGRPEINVGAFENIKAQPVPKEYEKQKLIRSHLPVRHAVKMGANSLRSKPVRLVFTVFLSIVAFILFGLASTLMLFDGRSITVQTFVDADDKYMILSKAYYGRYTSYVNGEIDYRSDEEEKQDTPYTKDEYDKLARKYNGAIAVGSFNGRIENIRLGQHGGQYYTEYIQNTVLADDSIEMLHGVRPTADDEIAISDYLYDAIALPKTKFTTSDGREINVTEPADILYGENNRITLDLGSGKQYKVVGVFRIETASSEFGELEKAAREDKPFTGSSDVTEKWQRTVRSSLLPSIMVTERFMREYAAQNSGQAYNVYDHFIDTQGDLSIWYTHSASWESRIYNIERYGAENTKPKLTLYDFSGGTVTALSGRSVAMQVFRVGKMYAGAYKSYMQDVNNSAEESERVSAEILAAQAEYEAEHLLVDRFFDQTAYEADKNSWMVAYEAAKAQAAADGIVFDENAYRAANPEPTKTDKLDSEYKYYRGDAEYNKAFDAHMNRARETAGTFKAYKTLLYDAAIAAENSYRASNPEPERPADGASSEEMNAYNQAWQAWDSGRWNARAEAESAVNPLDKLENLRDLQLTKDETLDLFAQARNLFGDTVEIGIENTYNNFEKITLAGMFFEDITDSTAYLSDELFDKYYVSDGNSYNYSSKYETKYVAPKDAFIGTIYVPYSHDTSSVQEIVDLTYERGSDDSTVVIKNSQMEQLDMFIDLADTLETAFLIAGIVLALFAFLLMFNFISASITAKKKEIGILRAIGARTLDVYKIFISEALIIALICFVISAAGTFGLCAVLNSAITEGTFIEISIFAFGPLSVLCIFAIALVTAIVSTVIPVALYSRKPPIASIRAI